MSITSDTLRIEQALRAEIAGMTDEQTRDIVAAWARAWDDVAPELDRALQDLTASVGAEGRVTRRAALRSARLTAALRLVAEHLSTVAHDAGVRVIGDLQAVVAAAGRAQHDLISSQLPPGRHDLVLSFDRVDADAIKAIVRRSSQQIHAATRPLSTDAVRQMRRELVRGVVVGANPRETARRMVTRTEGVFNGGASRALTIARTETLDAMRAGAQAAQQLNAEVLTGWTWSATLSADTCPACWTMDGTEWPLDEPGPDGHQNCRCARVPLTKPWSDLGIDRTEPASDRPDKQTRFDALSTDQQRQILGPGRYAAYTAGGLPMDQWAVKRSTDGWRDSYVPVPVGSTGRSERLAS